MQYRGTIWYALDTEGNNIRGNVYVHVTIPFNKKELNKFVQELVRLDIKVDNGVSVIKIIEPVEMKDVKILSSSELAGFRWGIWSKKKSTYPIYHGRRSPDWESESGIESNIRIRFTGSAVLEGAQLVQDSGSIWIRSSGEGSIHNGGTIRFSAQELDEVKIKDVGVLPAAKLNPGGRSEQRNEDATSMLVRFYD